jgi:hypothetical protein
MPSVEIEIGELVLEGFSPFERYRIGEAVERELTRLLVEQGVAPNLRRGGEIENLDAGVFQLQANAQVGFTGVQIAQAVYSSLGE